MSDEKAESSPATEETKDESLETSEAGTETPEGEESKSPSKAERRIQQLVQQRKEAENIVNWYRSNIGDPNDVLQFQQWKQAQLEAAKKAEAEGELSPEKLKQIRELVRKADPEYREMIERQKAAEENRVEAQFDAAEDEVREIAKSIGIPEKNEAAISRLGRQIMLEVDSDPKLRRLWDAGNMSCIKKAYKALDENFIVPLRKSVPVQAKQAAEKRTIAKLPTLPSAQGVLSGKGQAAPEEKGITKKTHDDAWEILQQSLQD